MRRFLIALSVLLAVGYLGSQLAEYVAIQRSPARWLGWESDLRAAAPSDGAGAKDAPFTTDELLGFSRYLPAETESYSSLLQIGRFRRAAAATQAWQRVEAEKEVQQFLKQARGMLEQPGLDPEIRAALDLLWEAFDSEITIATSPEVSRDVLAIGRSTLLSLAVLAPDPHAAGSESATLLEEKRAPLREAWLTSLPQVRVPAFVVAARVQDEARFNDFVHAMVDEGWQAALAELGSKAPPEIRAALQKAYSPVTISKVRMLRWQARLGDFVPHQQLEQALKRLSISEEERTALIDALSAWTLQVHLGFVGEYLTLVVSSDDQFVRQIVERYEGRSKATLAAAPAFARIRQELNANSLAVAYTDSAATQQEFRRTLFPLIEQLTDPEFLLLLGAPPQFMSTVERLHTNLEPVLLSQPVRNEMVLTIDRGLRQFNLNERATTPAEPEPKTPLRVPGLVPADAIAFWTVRSGSFEGLWDYARLMVRQMQEQMVATLGMQRDPRFIQIIQQQRLKLDAVLKPIDDKLSPSMQGEMGIVAGRFTMLKIEGLPEDRESDAPPLPELPIPTGAVVIYSPAPDDAIAGFRDLLRAALDLMRPRRPGAVPPVSLDKDTEDGIEVWLLTIDALSNASIEGLEPHLARVGDALVLSTSFELTKQIRDTLQKKAPAIGTTKVHQAMKDLLPATARDQAFVNGGALNQNLRKASETLFKIWTEHRKELRFSDEDMATVGVVKRYVDLALEVAGCLRGSAASTVSDGRVDTLREWVHLEDLEPK